MPTPLTTVAAAVSTIFAAVLLAMLAACGGQPGPPCAAPSASTSPAAPSRAACLAKPRRPASRVRALPRRLSAQVLSYLACVPVALAERRRSARARHPRPRPVVPPVPELVQISVGSYLVRIRERPFERISFTFTTAFPSYRFEFAAQALASYRR